MRRKQLIPRIATLYCSSTRNVRCAISNSVCWYPPHPLVSPHRVDTKSVGFARAAVEPADRIKARSVGLARAAVDPEASADASDDPYIRCMGQIHQKGSLSAKHEAKRGRGASPLAGLPERAANDREMLAEAIRALVKSRKLTVVQTAALAKLPPQRVSLLLAGKLYSFTDQELARIRKRIAGEG